MTGQTEKTTSVPDACQDLVRHNLSHVTQRSADSDDIAQDACVRALEAETRGSIREPGRYLLRITRNLFIDRTRRRKRERDLFDDQYDGDTLAGDMADPERILAGKQALGVALTAIDALPPRCREAFRLHRFEGLSYTAVARKMGISVSMVEKHISEAMRKIGHAVRGGDPT